MAEKALVICLIYKLHGAVYVIADREGKGAGKHQEKMQLP